MSAAEVVTLYTDGGCFNNGQKDPSKRRMVVAVFHSDGRKLIELEEAGGSNNIAEFLAVREALRWAVTNQCNVVQIRTDSKNNLAWTAGRIGSKLTDYNRVVSIHNAVSELKKQLASFDIVWIPREENVAGIYLERKLGG